MKKEIVYASLEAPLGKGKRSLISSHGAQNYGGSGEYSSNEFNSWEIDWHVSLADPWLPEWYDLEARFRMNSDATMVEQWIVQSLGIFRTFSRPLRHQ